MVISVSPSRAAPRSRLTPAASASTAGPEPATRVSSAWIHCWPGLLTGFASAARQADAASHLLRAGYCSQAAARYLQRTANPLNAHLPDPRHAQGHEWGRAHSGELRHVGTSRCIVSRHVDGKPSLALGPCEFDANGAVGDVPNGLLATWQWRCTHPPSPVTTNPSTERPTHHMEV